MTTVAAQLTPLNGNGVHATNGHGQAILTPLTPIPHDSVCHDSTIHSPTTHISTFHQNSHDLAMVFSQVPWMKFSIVAQPDLVQLAGNETLKGFVHQVTSMTIATVSKQIHEEITLAVNEVIKNIAGSVNERMTKVHTGIMQEIVSVTAQKTATDYERLGFPPFNQLLKDLTAGEKHHDCHCSPVTKPPVVKPVDEPIIIKPTPVVQPTTVTPPVVQPTPAPGTEVKPVLPTPVAVKATTVPPPSLDTAFWIWSTEYKKNPRPAPGHTRAFRRTVISPTPVTAMTLDILGDDIYTVYVNGKLVGSGTVWDQPDRYTVTFEPTTRVVVAVLASQGPGAGEVGLVAAGRVWDRRVANPVPIDFATNTTWLTFAAEGVSDKFIEPTFVDAAWTAAYVVTAFGTSPWQKTKPVANGKAVGKRIVGIDKIPEAPVAPPADAWVI